MLLFLRNQRSEVQILSGAPSFLLIRLQNSLSPVHPPIREHLRTESRALTFSWLLAAIREAHACSQACLQGVKKGIVLAHCRQITSSKSQWPFEKDDCRGHRGKRRAVPALLDESIQFQESAPNAAGAVHRDSRPDLVPQVSARRHYRRTPVHHKSWE